MKIKRCKPKSVKLPTIKDTKDVQLLWCDDGWTYIPQIKLRRKFESQDEGTCNMEYTEEVWDGVVPGKVLYAENVAYSVYNHRKMWMEATNEYAELYVIDEA
jgi:hypothetical protein